MAEGFGSAGANTALDALVAAYPWIKLHTGAPGSAATANAATETTRKQATWGAASGGTVSNSNTLTWTSIAGSQDATHFSAWTASSGGTFGFSGTITANAYTAGDTYEVAVGDLDVSVTLAS
jgi:hypothetical protein